MRSVPSATACACRRTSLPPTTPPGSSAFEPQNGTYAGRGVPSSSTHRQPRQERRPTTPPAEQMGYLTRMMDQADVAWQIGELGRIDLGGGGTVATEVAHQGSPWWISRACAVHALALRGGQQERPVHGLPRFQHLPCGKAVKDQQNGGSGAVSAAPFCGWES